MSPPRASAGQAQPFASAYPPSDPCGGLAANADAESDLEQRLVDRLRSQGRLRYELCVLASWFVERRGWEPLSFARLSDYATERLGRSARSVNDFAHVGVALRRLPAVRLALVDGSLSWTKVRLIARVAQPEDEKDWVAFAHTVSAEVLSREVRRVDRGSLESGGLAADASPSITVDIACSREVYGLWHEAGRAACRSAGAMLHPSARTELILAEVFSALPADAQDDEAEGTPLLLSAPLAAASVDEPARPFRFGRSRGSAPEAGGLWPAFCETADVGTGGSVPWGRSSTDDPGRVDAADSSAPGAGGAVDRLRDVQSADAFELDRRLCEVIAIDQRLCAEVGPLLRHVFHRGVHRALGFRTREAYARERLGVDPSWCRMLLRIESAALRSPEFSRAYRAGELTALQASTLVPLIVADLEESHVARWVPWARGATLRRLRDDVDSALTLHETCAESWGPNGGLPIDAVPDCVREADGSRVGAAPDCVRQADGSPIEDGPLTAPNELLATSTSSLADNPTSPDREIGARSTPPVESTNVRMFLDTEVARLLRATLCTMRRHLERKTGRLPSEGEALGVIAAHVLATWNTHDPKRRRSDTIFARDGWRCAVPGCSSMRSLHAHHIQYRSRGGSDDASNLITLCAFHHQRGVHGGTLKCSGRAPHALRFELGVRGSRALLEYRSGDRRVI